MFAKRGKWDVSHRHRVGKTPLICCLSNTPPVSVYVTKNCFFFTCGLLPLLQVEFALSVCKREILIKTADGCFMDILQSLANGCNVGTVWQITYPSLAFGTRALHYDNGKNVTVPAQ